MPRDLASIVAEYARHTEVEKLNLAFDDQESVGNTSIAIPVASRFYSSPLIIQWRHISGEKFFSFRIKRFGVYLTVSRPANVILPSRDLIWMDDLGDKYKKIGAAYREFMAEAMARY